MKMTRYKVVFETGPTAADCYTWFVNSNTIESAKRMVESKCPSNYVMFTSVAEDKGNMTQFNAAQARKLVNDAYTAQGEYLREETEKCLKAIEVAAKRGVGAMCYYNTDEVIVARLKELGFTVKVMHDQRDGNFLNIAW